MSFTSVFFVNKRICDNDAENRKELLSVVQNFASIVKTGIQISSGITVKALQRMEEKSQDEFWNSVQYVKDMIVWFQNFRDTCEKYV